MAQRVAEAQPRSACECCGMLPARPRRAVDDGFNCRCTQELMCGGCNHCLPHCRCKGVAELDVPLAEQLSVAKHEWRRMGVKI